jgi:hypothetical protein
MTADCKHEEFWADVAVGRIGEEDEGSGGRPTWYSAEVQVKCVQCGTPFRAVDPEIPKGALRGRITSNIDGTLINIPMWPIDEGEPPIGKLAGYTIEKL